MPRLSTSGRREVAETFVFTADAVTGGFYGHIETYEDRVDHLLKLRELQDKTGGFQAFVPLAYHPKGNDVGGSFSSGIDDLKTLQ